MHGGEGRKTGALIFSGPVNQRRARVVLPTGVRLALASCSQAACHKGTVTFADSTGATKVQATGKRIISIEEQVR